MHTLHKRTYPIYTNPYNIIKTLRHTLTYKCKHTQPNKLILKQIYTHSHKPTYTTITHNTYTQHTYMHTETNAHTIQTHISYIHKCIHGHIYIHTHIQTKLHTKTYILIHENTNTHTKNKSTHN